MRHLSKLAIALAAILTAAGCKQSADTVPGIEYANYVKAYTGGILAEGSGSGWR